MAPPTRAFLFFKELDISSECDDVNSREGIQYFKLRLRVNHKLVHLRSNESNQSAIIGAIKG